MGFGFKKVVWIWIGVAIDVVNFTKEYVKDYFKNIILMVKKIKMIATYYPSSKNTHNLIDMEF